MKETIDKSRVQGEGHVEALAWNLDSAPGILVINQFRWPEVVRVRGKTGARAYRYWFSMFHLIHSCDHIIGNHSVGDATRRDVSFESPIVREVATRGILYMSIGIATSLKA